MYSGFDPVLIPDLRVANALNYRVSWQTTLGGVPPDVIEDNLKAWSADHCSNEPALVKGIFFSSRKIATTEEPRIWDLAPSILALVGAPVPSGLDGRNLYGPQVAGLGSEAPRERRETPAASGGGGGGR